MIKLRLLSVLTLAALVIGMAAAPAFAATAAATAPTYDITTLAGKVASVNGTAGLNVRFSAFIENEAEMSAEAPNPGPYGPAITPTHVLSSPLDGTAVLPPDVTVNQDTAAAPQNETAIAVDPNNPNRVVASANDYVTRTWNCTVGGVPCSALGDGYSGTYFSNDSGKTWCCNSSSPSDLGTLIPGVDHLAGGQYDAGGDPALTFDSRGNVYYAGLGFDRNAPPNTVTVNKGTFDSSGKLTWGGPSFINQTTSPAIFNDKEWIAADASPTSPFRDRVYVTWTRFIFNPTNGRYVQSPIAVSFSANGGATWSAPQLIVGNVLYGQGSRPVVGPDGTVYVFWDGSTRLATLDSTFMVKSKDGGVTWSKPVAVSQLVDIVPLANTAFRVNSFPAAAVAPNGDLHVAWTSEMSDGGGLCPAATNTGCHASVQYSMSSDGGMTWSAPVAGLPSYDSANRMPVGYPVTQPNGSTLNAPAARRVDSLWPGVAVTPAGNVYVSAYVADVVSPWQTCAKPATPTSVGRIDCLTLGNYINNARLNYVVRDVTTGVAATVTTQPINTRYGFGGGFIGDYTGLAAGSDGAFHALWTDTNNVQTVTWFYGFQFVPTPIHQQDVVYATGKY